MEIISELTALIRALLFFIIDMRYFPVTLLFWSKLLQSPFLFAFF